MNVIQCENGHFYDGDSFPACPHCGAPARQASSVPAAAQDSRNEHTGKTGKTEKKRSGIFGFLKNDRSTKTHSEPPSYNPPVAPVSAPPVSSPPMTTQPESSNSDPISFRTQQPQPSGSMPSQPVSANPEPFNTQQEDFWAVKEPEPEKEKLTAQTDSFFHPTDGKPAEAPVPETPPAPPQESSALRDEIRHASANSEGKTLSYFNSMIQKQSDPVQETQPGTDPVVGWLVAVKGAHFGESFVIGSGQNAIGRAASNRIVIARDGSVSRESHAILIYEPRKRQFYLEPGSGSSTGLTYLNGDFITSIQQLQAGDTIELGSTKLIFVPLCGEKFTWEDYIAKD